MVQQGERGIILFLMLALFAAKVNANNSGHNFLQIYNNVEWLQGVSVALAMLGVVWSSLAIAGTPLLLMILKLGIILIALPALLQNTEVTNSDPEVSTSQPEPESTTTMPPRMHTHRSGLQNGISYLMKTIPQPAEVLTHSYSRAAQELKSAIQKDRVNVLFRVVGLIFSLVHQ